MSYKIFILKKAQKELAKLPRKEYTKIKQLIFELSANPRPAGVKKLRNRDAWRVRHGNYRIIYEIKDNVLTITIVRIAHRREAYRK